MAELDELKATFDHLTEAFNAHNLDAFMAGLHNEVTIFNPISPFPMDGKATVQQFYRLFLDHHERVTLTRINSQFRIVGTTGLVWGHTAFTLKPKDGPLSVLFIRQTWMFTKADGKWLVIAAHFSRVPSGN